MKHDWAQELLQATSPQRPDLLRLYRELVHDEALTDHASRFARRDALRAVAERLPTGAPVDQIEQVTDALLSHDPDQVIALGPARGQLTALDVIRRPDGTVVPADADEPRYTTRGLLLTEQHMITSALQRLDDGIATVDPAVVQHAIERRTLSGEQAAMVRHLTGSGHGVDIVVGKAGTGKTYALDAARDAWTREGIRVNGVALAARTALELQDAAGVPSTTLARLLARLENGQPGSPLAPGSVLVVDEAGMVGTRQLARLLAQAQAGDVKVVLVGDPHQLPEINAGGLFRALTTRLPAVELADNRRQQHAWEVDALDQLRHGDPADAIATYRQHGRIVTADTAEAAREQLVVDWWESYQHDDPTSAVMVALRRADVDDLNDRARLLLAAAGQLTGPTLEIDGAAFQAGDRIVCLRNERRVGVVNGTLATITTVHPDQRTITIRTDDDRQVVIPADYLDAGHVTHGYAITGHKAQGLTVDHTFVLGSADLYREWGYVALSRGRLSNRMYVHPAALDPGLDRHGPATDRDPVVSLTARLGRTRAHAPVSDPVPAMASRWRQLYRQLTDPAVTRQRELAQQHDALVDRHDTLARLVAQDEQHLAEATRGLARLRSRPQRKEVQARLHRHRERLTETQKQLRQTARQLSRLAASSTIAANREECLRLGRQIDENARARIHEFAHDPPAYLRSSLGAPPQDPSALSSWRDAAQIVETYRLRWAITDPHRPLGEPPHDPLQQSDYRRTVDAIDRAHIDLRNPERGRSHAIGLGR